MNELPWRCRACHAEQMVDMDHLERWQIDTQTSARGFTCKECGIREAISYSNTLLDGALKRLIQMRPTHRKFPYYFAKTLRRAEYINRRNYGTRGYHYLAPSR